MELLQGFGVSKVLLILGLVIIVDFVSGVFAAHLSLDDTVVSKKWNDGLIRKGNMVFAAFGCFVFDLIVGFNFIEFIPFNETLVSLGFARFGLAEVIALGMVMGEVISIFENWKKANIKIPSFITTAITKANELFFK